jgi:starch-binding outer membrane protein, SusD/RagB family
MKRIKYIILLAAISFIACKKSIDLAPISNSDAATFYSNVTELNSALIGCYSGMQKPLIDEWTLTELRSDNVVQGFANSTSNVNRDLSDLDMFFPNVSHQGLYTYWLNSYYNIRNTNLLLNALGANYTDAAGTLVYDSITIPVENPIKRRIAAEASFIRAYHYFNLVRLYGDVFLVHEPITPDQAKQVNRSPTAQIYKLIIADLQNAAANGNTAKFNVIPAAELGRANSWSAKALLAKVYLTLNQKTEATTLLQDVITNSGYALQPTYANIFSITNEMNSEILFAIRYKSGGLGIGSPLPNLFAPLNSGSAIVNGDGRGFMFPSQELNNAYFNFNLTGVSVKKDSLRVVLTNVPANANILPGMSVTGTQITAGTTVAAIVGNVLTLSQVANATSTTSTLTIADPRRASSIGNFSATVRYPAKLISNPAVINDAENDWMVIRYADVLLMLAEAQGNSPASIALINQTRNRSKLALLDPVVINTNALFEKALADERRFEFAFENQRWFDMQRMNITSTTLTIEQTLKNHFATMYPLHYTSYPNPRLSLTEMQAFVVPNRMLLPIPQREIDNNTQIVILQNPGY